MPTRKRRAFPNSGKITLAAKSPLRRAHLVSTVYKAEHKDGSLLAVKFFEQQPNAQLLYDNEVTVMQQVPEDSAYFLPLRTTGCDDGCNFIAMDYAPFGTLRELLALRGALPEEEAIFIAEQIVRLSF